MRICILGCGRMGALTANLLSQEGHEVTVIDRNLDSFKRLASDFKGKKCLGNGLEISTLEIAGLDKMDAFIATTNYDTRNIFGATLAKKIFSIPKVVARFYDQDRAVIFNKLGIETICVTSVGADLIQDIILGK